MLKKQAPYPEILSYDELAQLINLVNQIYGFDFSGYSGASLKRRVTRLMQLQHLSMFDLKTKLINEPEYFESFVIEITVNVTEMFRDPRFYAAVKEAVIPYMRSYPKIKMWNAGCSTGEELYSFAILFQEAGIYDRTFFYGTDVNTQVLEKAKDGIYELQKMKLYSENYLQTGATDTLSNYYTARYDAASIKNTLKKNVLFSSHNLVSDGVFNEFQLISCRNVLIYFNPELQKKTIELFYDSLANFGFLCLGAKESLRGNELNKFKVIDKKYNIYQKQA